MERGWACKETEGERQREIVWQNVASSGGGNCSVIN